MSDADERFIGDVGKLWEQTRDTLESFANTYLSAPAQEQPLSGPDWVAANFKLAGEMWLLGLQGVSLVVQRTVEAAQELNKNG